MVSDDGTVSAEVEKQLLGTDDKAFRVLNLGAGVQSTAIFLMIIDGELPPVDYAIFSDTGDEPRSVYDHVNFLDTLGGPEIVRVSAGNLGDNLIQGQNATGQRFVSIPTFLSRANDGKNDGIGRRQCTKEYKLVPIEQEIRRRCGLAKGERMKKNVSVTQVFGLSFDEPRRVDRVKGNFHGRKNWFCEFPLFDDFMTRADCVRYLEKRLPQRVVPRSACVFCPYKRDDEWILLKETDPEGWARAVQIDNAIRDKTSVCTRGMDSVQFLHRSCQPLELVQLRPGPVDRQTKMNFSDMDCEGMCGV